MVRYGLRGSSLILCQMYPEYSERKPRTKACSRLLDRHFRLWFHREYREFHRKPPVDVASNLPHAIVFVGGDCKSDKTIKIYIYSESLFI